MNLGRKEEREPPVIQEPVVGVTREVRRDSAVTLNCRATGIPEPTFQWYFNDTPVSPNNPPLAPGVTVDISDDHRTGQLVIPSVKETMTGRYSCRASNSLPGDPSPVTAVSPPITIIVSYLDSWGVRENRELMYYAYRYFKIDCDDVTTQPSHAGSIEYKWYRYSAVGKSIEVNATDRIFIDNKGTIHFTTFDPDMDYFNIPGSLPYSCGLSSSSIEIGGEVKLVPVSREDNNQQIQSPVLQYSSDQVTALNGSTARLECFFSGFPIPEIQWKDNTGEIIKAGFKYGLDSNNRVLVINDVSAADEVAFTCVANISQLREEKILPPLNVTSPPYWVQPLMSQTIPQGRNVDFYCHAESMVHETPPGPPRWFKNGATLQTVDTPKYRFSDESRKLTVLNVQKPDDIACYQCIVSNSVGDTFGSACLNVLLPIQILTRPPEEQVISQGHKVNMTVQAIGDPLYPLSYVWLRNNRCLPMDTTTPSYYVHSSTGLLLYVNTTGLSPEQMKNITGEYRCVIFHPYESKILVINVRLEGD